MKNRKTYGCKFTIVCTTLDTKTFLDKVKEYFLQAKASNPAKAHQNALISDDMFSHAQLSLF